MKTNVCVEATKISSLPNFNRDRRDLLPIWHRDRVCVTSRVTYINDEINNGTGTIF